jgi:hypothetical protein
MRKWSFKWFTFKREVDLIAFIWYPLGLWLGFTGRVSWWVLLMFFLALLEFKIIWKKR